MKCSEKQMMDTRDMVGLPNNPRTITTKDLNRLCDSIRQNGWWPHRPIAVERQEWTDKWVVLDGNQRLKAARRMKMRMVPVVIYSELTDDERTDLILRSNINNGEWDTGLLQTDFEGVDFEDIGLKIELPEPPDVLDIQVFLFPVQLGGELVQQDPHIAVGVLGPLIAPLRDLDADVTAVQLVELFPEILVEFDRDAPLPFPAQRHVDQPASHRASQYRRYSSVRPWLPSQLQKSATIGSMSFVSSRR